MPNNLQSANIHSCKMHNIRSLKHHALHCADLELVHSVYRPVGAFSTLVFAPSEDGNGESRMHELYTATVMKLEKTITVTNIQICMAL